MASDLRQAGNEFYPYTQVAPLSRSLLQVGQLQSPSPKKQKQKNDKKDLSLCPQFFKRWISLRYSITIHNTHNDMRG